MIFISAGHNTGGLKPDPGAVANGYTEAKLAIEIRDLVVKELRKDNNLKIVTDNDDERLGEYLSRIKTGNGSVVLEFHFDAASPAATGTTILIEAEADRLDKAFAKEIVDKTAEVLKIKNIINDTLKSRGKWSMKRLTAFVVMVFVLALGVFIVVSDLVLKVEVNRYAIDVFQSLLFFEAALMGINEFGKKLENKETKTEEE